MGDRVNLASRWAGVGFRCFYSHFQCTAGLKFLEHRDAKLCSPWGGDAGGFPQCSAVCLPVLGGVSPTFAPLPWQCCAIAPCLVLGLLCDCGGRGRGSVLLVRLGRVCAPEPQEWGSLQGPLSSITLLAPSMPSWERSHLTSTSRHPLRVIMFLEPRFCTNWGLYHHPHHINTVAPLSPWVPRLQILRDDCPAPPYTRGLTISRCWNPQGALEAMPADAEGLTVLSQSTIQIRHRGLSPDTLALPHTWSITISLLITSQMCVCIHFHNYNLHHFLLDF